MNWMLICFNSTVSLNCLEMKLLWFGQLNLIDLNWNYKMNVRDETKFLCVVSNSGVIKYSSICCLLPWLVLACVQDASNWHHPSIFYTCLSQLRVTRGLEPITAVIGQKGLPGINQLTWHACFWEEARPTHPQGKHTNSTQKDPRQDSNLESSCCEVTVLTTTSPCSTSNWHFQIKMICWKERSLSVKFGGKAPLNHTCRLIKVLQSLWRRRKCIGGVIGN